VKVSYVPVRQKGLKVIARIDADGFYYAGSFAGFDQLNSPSTVDRQSEWKRNT